jgi:hypothetical protein
LRNSSTLLAVVIVLLGNALPAVSCSEELDANMTTQPVTSDTSKTDPGESAKNQLGPPQKNSGEKANQGTPGKIVPSSHSSPSATTDSQYSAPEKSDSSSDKTSKKEPAQSKFSFELPIDSREGKKGKAPNGAVQEKNLLDTFTVDSASSYGTYGFPTGRGILGTFATMQGSMREHGTEKDDSTKENPRGWQNIGDFDLPIICPKDHAQRKESLNQFFNSDAGFFLLRTSSAAANCTSFSSGSDLALPENDGSNHHGPLPAS